jgi:hypothetical protein
MWRRSFEWSIQVISFAHLPTGKLPYVRYGTGYQYMFRDVCSVPVSRRLCGKVPYLFRDECSVPVWCLFRDTGVIFSLFCYRSVRCTQCLSSRKRMSPALSRQVVLSYQVVYVQLRRTCCQVLSKRS